MGADKVIVCPACVILRRRWYAICTQLKAYDAPLTAAQLAVIQSDQGKPEYQAALDALREHMKIHHAAPERNLNDNTR